MPMPRMRRPRRRAVAHALRHPRHARPAPRRPRRCAEGPKDARPRHNTRRHLSPPRVRLRKVPQAVVGPTRAQGPRGEARPLGWARLAPPVRQSAGQRAPVPLIRGGAVGGCALLPPPWRRPSCPKSPGIGSSMLSQAPSDGLHGCWERLAGGAHTRVSLGVNREANGGHARAAHACTTAPLQTAPFHRHIPGQRRLRWGARESEHSLNACISEHKRCRGAEGISTQCATGPVQPRRLGPQISGPRRAETVARQWREANFRAVTERNPGAHHASQPRSPNAPPAPLPRQELIEIRGEWGRLRVKGTGEFLRGALAGRWDPCTDHRWAFNCTNQCSGRAEWPPA
jgi:hypothetical protein